MDTEIPTEVMALPQGDVGLLRTDIARRLLASREPPHLPRSCSSAAARRSPTSRGSSPSTRWPSTAMPERSKVRPPWPRSITRACGWPASLCARRGSGSWTFRPGFPAVPAWPTSSGVAARDSSVDPPPRPRESRGARPMITYALIHGAASDSWYWHLLAAELRTRGHDVVAPDLPCDDDGAGLPTTPRSGRSPRAWSACSGLTSNATTLGWLRLISRKRP
jgi:hypothetical protein